MAMCIRITPACAGKTDTIMYRPSFIGDHPRMCGKDVNQICKIFDRSGSPPHVRERPTAVSSDDLAFGITPACAGKTLQGYSNDNDVRDHPRMCGKDPICDSRPFYMLGSPPHVRERLKASGSEDFLVGITPACAGKTSYSREHFIHVWDHPRMCGKDL